MRIHILFGASVMLFTAACGSDVSVFGVPTTAAQSTGAGGSGATNSGNGGGTDITIGASVGTGGSNTTIGSVTSVASTGTGMAGMLACGNTSCQVGGDNACCWDSKEWYDPPQAECVSGPIDADSCRTAHTNAGTETRIECQLPSHCSNGEICCGWRISTEQYGTWYAETACKQECDWPDIELCDDNYDCPTVNTNQGQVKLVCKASTLLPAGYLVCGLPQGG